MTYNFGNWMIWTFLFIFFWATLLVDHHKLEPWMKDNIKTHHALYSIWTVGTDEFTKRARITCFGCEYITVVLFTAVFYKEISYSWTEDAVRLLVFTIWGVIIGIVPQYLFGFLFRRCEANHIRFYG